MATTFTPLPNVDAALVLFLRAHPDLVPLHGGRVGTQLESAAASLRVSSLGGQVPWPWEGRAEYQVECWGGSQEQAVELAHLACAAAYDFRGPIAGGRVVAAQPSLWPLWSPDPNGRARYIVQVEITVYPEA